MSNFTPMRVGEEEIFTVDYVNNLAPGETIISAVWTCSVIAGSNASPNSMISGAATISGTKVSQMIEALTPGTYAPVCSATTSLGQVIELPDIGQGLLTVVA